MSIFQNWSLKQKELKLNYADLRIASGVDTSDFAEKTYLGNLKFNVDKLDTDKLKNVK